MSDIEALRAEESRLRSLAHGAPLNKVFQDHTGRKFLGTHSMAWATTARAWMKARSELDAALSQSPSSLPTPAATPTDSANPPPVESVGPNSEAQS